jgi:FAD:protein FMN transferase
MQGLFLLGLLAVAAPTAESGESTLQRFEFTQVEMAVPIKIVLYAADNAIATTAAEAAFARLHQLNAVMSDYNPESELRRLCDTAGGGKAVPVSNDLWRVMACAQQVATRSDGAFDITVSPVVWLWRRARRTRELPSPERLKAALELVGYRNVKLDEKQHAVELLKPDMRLDLGGIAKGYAVAEALSVLRREGIGSAMVDAGGDIGLGDAPPGKPGWRIGIAPPEPNSPPRLYLWLANTALATSGDMWQSVTIGGQRYSHIVDPHTGLGLTDHCNVTILGKDGMTTDALAKVVSVLGPTKGIELIDATPGTAAMVVRAPDGKVEVHESRGWKELLSRQPHEP